MIKGYLKFGKLNDLIDNFHKKSDTEPDDTMIYFCLGIAYYYSGDINKAEEYLERMEKENSKLPLMREYIGDICYKKGDTEKAVKLIRALLVEEPYNADLYTKLGYYLRKIKEPWQVREPLMKVGLLNPHSTIAFVAQAIVNFDSNNLKEAEKLAKLAIEQDATFADAHYILGQIFESQQKRKLAQKEYEMALSYDPAHIDAKKALEELK
jgi:tetratricopeptide (TPR) repeat protein